MHDEVLKRTPLYEFHAAHGARFTPFGGWEMPVQYSGLVEEHHAVRQAVGLFDVSHMGEVIVRGPEALSYLEGITCNRVSDLSIGKAQYSMFLNEQGGVVDDIIIYRLDEQEYLICVNAANTAKDVAWMQKHAVEGAAVEDVSAQYAQIAVQGPRAQQVLEEVLSTNSGSCALEQFPAFSFQERALSKVPGMPSTIIARTGYTGEDGFEIFCTPSSARAIAETLLEFGKPMGMKLAGLGARDTLRLEACYPLHGHEISDEHSPLEAGLGWVVKLDKGPFIGRDALLRQREEGLGRKLVGLEVLDPGIVREGAELFAPGAERPIGIVTSGTKPPTVNRAVALGFVSSEHAKLGTELAAQVRTRRLTVKVIKKPFYKRTA